MLADAAPAQVAMSASSLSPRNLSSLSYGSVIEIRFGAMFSGLLIRSPCVLASGREMVANGLLGYCVAGAIREHVARFVGASALDRVFGQHGHREPP